MRTSGVNPMRTRPGPALRLSRVSRYVQRPAARALHSSPSAANGLADQPKPTRISSKAALYAALLPRATVQA